jgi:hypothetical protein
MSTVTNNEAPPALAFRRRALVWAPVTAAALIVAGFLLDPDIGASGREMAREYAEKSVRINCRR